jgi:hypothetical protein
MSWQKLFRVHHRPEDFQPIEEHVSGYLCAEPGRTCSFVSSAAFCRFRIRALYRTKEMDGPLYGPGGIVLSFMPDPLPSKSGWVMLSVVEDAKPSGDEIKTESSG